MEPQQGTSSSGIPGYFDSSKPVPAHQDGLSDSAYQPNFHPKEAFQDTGPSEADSSTGVEAADRVMMFEPSQEEDNDREAGGSSAKAPNMGTKGSHESMDGNGHAAHALPTDPASDQPERKRSLIRSMSLSIHEATTPRKWQVRSLRHPSLKRVSWVDRQTSNGAS